MKQGRHAINTPRHSGRKRTALIVALALLLTLSAGLTAAFLIDETPDVENSFNPAGVPISIDETVEDGAKTRVQIVNDGNTDAYIRVAVIGNAVNEKGGIIGAADAPFTLGSGWVAGDDGYYYYTKPVAPQDTTENLLGSAIDLNGKQVTIVAESIQSDGVDASGNKPVFRAWGFDPEA